MDDQDFVLALLDLLDSSARELLVRNLAVQVASNVLVAAAAVDKCPVPIPHVALPRAFDELLPASRVDSDELVDSFLQDVRPPHEAHAYLDDYWNFIWEHAWPEGVAHVVLGPQGHDEYFANALVVEIERVAEEIGLPERQEFEAADLENFVAEWRRNFIKALADIQAG